MKNNQQYEIHEKGYYTLVLEGEFDPKKNSLTITYQSDSMSSSDLKKYLRSHFPKLAKKAIKSFETREGWFETELGTVGYMDVVFKN